MNRESEDKAALSKTLDVGGDGVAYVQELDTVVQIASERIIQSGYLEIGDEASGLGVSEGEEIDGLGEPGQADRRRSQRLQAAKQRIVEGARDEVEFVGNRVFLGHAKRREGREVGDLR